MECDERVRRRREGGDHLLHERHHLERGLRACQRRRGEEPRLRGVRARDEQQRRGIRGRPGAPCRRNDQPRREDRPARAGADGGSRRARRRQASRATPFGGEVRDGDACRRPDGRGGWNDDGDGGETQGNRQGGALGVFHLQHPRHRDDPQRLVEAPAGDRGGGGAVHGAVPLPADGIWRSARAALHLQERRTVQTRRLTAAGWRHPRLP